MLKQKGIETDLLLVPTLTDNPATFADHITETKMGRVSIWDSGSLNLEVLDQSTGKTVYFKDIEILDKNPNMEQLLSEYFEALLR